MNMIQTKVENLSEANREKVYQILPDFKGDYLTALDDETATRLWSLIKDMPVEPTVSSSVVTSPDGLTKSKSATEEEGPPQHAVEATRKAADEQTVVDVWVYSNGAGTPHGTPPPWPYGPPPWLYRCS